MESFYTLFKKINDNENLINEKIPQIIKLFDQNQINLAFLETKKLITDYPKNEILKNYFDKSSTYAYLNTNLDGIDVSVMYRGDSVYNYLGKTPIDSFLVADTWSSHILKFTFKGS